MRKWRPILRALTPAGWALLLAMLGSVAFALLGHPTHAILLGGFAFVIFAT